MFALKKIIIKKTITESLQVTDKVNLLQSHRQLRKNTLRRSCSAQTTCFLHCNTFKVSKCANDQQVTVIQSCSSFKHGNHPAALQTKHVWFTVSKSTKCSRKKGDCVIRKTQLRKHSLVFLLCNKTQRWEEEFLRFRVDTSSSFSRAHNKSVLTGQDMLRFLYPNICFNRLQP